MLCLTRRHRLALVAATLAASFVVGACSSGRQEPPLRRSKNRVFVMGFDGMSHLFLHAVFSS